MVTAAMKLKDAWLLGKQTMANLNNILKSRDITLLTKVRLVKAMVFPAVGREVGGRFRMRGDMYMYGRFMLMYSKIHHDIVNNYPPSN